MADCRMPEEFYEIVSKFLPPKPTPGSEGGRERIDYDVVVSVIWYVLTTGCRWRDVPPQMGCCGESARTRLREWEAAGVWSRVHVELLKLLRKDGKLDHETAIVDGVLVRAHGGGELTGPNPTDRGKPGTKYTLMVDKHGVPLAVRVAPANESDHVQILPLAALQFPRVAGEPGRPREKPERIYADAGYDSDATRAVLRCLGIEPHIRRKGGEHGSGLGKVRWVVERTVAWIKGLRRLRVRYDRCATIVEAWKTLAMSAICFRIWNNDVRLAN